MTTQSLLARRNQALGTRQSLLARSVYRDHLYCLAAMASVVAIQLLTIHVG